MQWIILWRRHVTPGRVTAILYCQLATRLRALAIILPIHLFYYHSSPRLQPYTIITVRMPITLNAGVRALTLLSLFSKRISFAHEISRVYPFTDAPHHTVYNWDYILKHDISKDDYCKHGYRLCHHSIEHPDGSGVEFRDRLSHETRHRRWRQLSQLQAATIRSGQWAKPNTIEILSRTSFLPVHWVRSAAREATMDETRRHNDVNHEYRIRPYQRENSNTIPTSQLSVIISQRTYNQWRDLTPESAIPRTERRLRVGTVRLHPSELSKVHRLHSRVRLQL